MHIDDKMQSAQQMRVYNETAFNFQHCGIARVVCSKSRQFNLELPSLQAAKKFLELCGFESHFRIK